MIIWKDQEFKLCLAGCISDCQKIDVGLNILLRRGHMLSSCKCLFTLNPDHTPAQFALLDSHSVLTEFTVVFLAV